MPKHKPKLSEAAERLARRMQRKRAKSDLEIEREVDRIFEIFKSLNPATTNNDE